MANSIAKNLLALKEKSFDINFDLEGTDYKAIETIGSGAYGVVCSALHKSTNAKVAIKKIPSIFELTQIAMRTYREMKILRHFKHDNIISIREILARGLKEGSSDHRFQDIYIVLDLMESDLHRIIHSSQPLTEEHTRYFLYQLLRGLKYIHSANVVHRDLKPSNLLVNENCDLKIGDFGMARGIACDTNEQDAMMTQYVATRWYRAPEIMLLPTAYNAAIDMWSVGCVFAEMLGRRQIFPGHTHRDQLNLIIGILGSPSTDFLQKTHSEMVRNYIRGLGKKKPESLEKLYPRASSSALSLLQSMLVIDPTDRISAENALRQPFLNKYHDEDDEPLCIPLFNFDFEKEAMDKEKLRLAITKEVLSFSCKKTDKETPMIFNFKPVPKSELEKSRGGNQSAKPLVPVVGSFKMAPVSAASQKQLHQTNDKPSNSTNLFQNLKQDLLQGSQTGNQKSLSGAKNSLKDALQPLHTEMQDTNLFVRSSKDVESITVSVKMDSKNDVDMASAKGEGDGKGLLVDTKARNSEDVEMLSAQAVAARHVEKTASDPVDTKALIKAALLSTRRKQLLESQTENSRPVTALQRQREREEKRRKKKERSNARKKKDVIKDVNKPSRRELLPLTDEDKSLLERWKNMQGPAAAAVTTATSTSTVSLPTNLNAHSDPPQFPIPTTQPVATIISDTQKGVKVSVSSGVDSGMFLNNPRQGIVDSSCIVQSQPSMILPTRQFGVPPEPAKDPYGMFVGLPSDGVVMSGDRNPLSPLTNVSLPGAVGSSEMGAFSQSVSQHPYPALPVVVAAGFNQNQIEPPSVGCIPSLVPLTQTPSTSAEQNDLPPPPHLQQQNYISSKPLLPSDHQAAPIPEFLASISTPMVKLVTLPEEIRTEKLPDNSRVGTGHSNPDSLSVLTRQLMRSHVEDLTLAHTPKGTGGGYGVGLDFHVEGLSGRCLQENSGVRQDSAPLSASLISDWLDVAGNLDANDLEALQHELELNSPAINQILDFNALPDP